ncbi:uncharacterized protein [Haliotis cracherodii]|uniref:uncharacterized protein n=1 Tax=Haliotis cracherodii TaxID=6455 RepID=UPI0039E9838F
MVFQWAGDFVQDMPLFIQQGMDVLVSTNRIQIRVHLKLLHTDQYTHFNFNHPLRTKTGIISTLALRAINLSSVDPKPEIEHLRQVFTHLNNYPANLVDKVISPVLHPTPRPATLKPESAPFRIALPFIGKASHIISRLLKQQANSDTHFTSSNSLDTMLRANDRNTTKPQEPKGVVYKIDCNCRQSYVGETSRQINTRIIERKTSTIISDSKSAISDHISYCSNHNINWDNVQIISNNLHDFTKRKLTEAVHIRRHKPSIKRNEGYFIPSACYELIKQ